VLRALGASFVTLESGSALRGCIDSLEEARPLFLDVARNAVTAMTHPRRALTERNHGNTRSAAT
jgi:AMMECR1 domain-containing protein